MIFSFDEFTVRPVRESDRNYIVAILEKDEFHRHMTADDFLQIVQGEETFACEDREGYVRLYLKTQTACRLTMLFADDDRERNRTILQRGLAWLMGVLQRNRCRELLFDTEGRELSLFARRHMGFQVKPEALSQLIPQPDVHGVIHGMWESRKKPVGSER